MFREWCIRDASDSRDVLIAPVHLLWRKLLGLLQTLHYWDAGYLLRRRLLRKPGNGLTRFGGTRKNPTIITTYRRWPHSVGHVFVADHHMDVHCSKVQCMLHSPYVTI